MFSRRIVRISVMLAVAAVASALAHPAARAQGSDATEKVTQLNREALAAIDKREFEKARELLKRALDLCARARGWSSTRSPRARTSTWAW